jgi:hypothetical protein
MAALPMNSQTSAFAGVPVPDAAELGRLLRQAIAVGGQSTLTTHEDERTRTALELLATAADRMVPAAAAAQGVQAISARVWMHGFDTFLAELVDELRSNVAAAIRLVARALEVHSRDTYSYATDQWNQTAFKHAIAVLDLAHKLEGRAAPHPLGTIKAAAIALNRAIVATQNDQFAFPEHVASCLGNLLTLYQLCAVMREHDAEKRR